MADIHVLAGRMSWWSRRKVCKSYAFHFMIPVEVRVANATLDPELVAFESVVPNIVAGELAAIRAGEVVEKAVDIDYNRTATNPDILVKVRARYAELEPLALIEYTEKYRQYLAEVTAT